MTGMRIGEMFELKWKDIDFDLRIISVRPDASLKNEDGREIPINDQLVPILKALPRTSEFVFPGEDMKSQRMTCQHALSKARKKAGFPDF